MGNNSDKFDWFGWEEDPLNKYKQPKPSNHQINGSGYPHTDIDMDGVMVGVAVMNSLVVIHVFYTLAVDILDYMRTKK